MTPQSPEKDEEGEEIVLVEKEECDEEIVANASKKKEEGNAHFANQHYPQAAASYREGLSILEETSAPAAKELHISLNSNLAMVAIKVKDYKVAEHHCTTVIEKWDDAVAKVWYRRGLVRENLDKLEPALEDFKTSVRLLQQQKQNDLIKTALQALDRVHKRILKEKADEGKTAPTQPKAAVIPTMNGSSSGGAVAMNDHYNTQPVARQPPPPPEQQKQDVLKLLINRSVSLKQQPPIGVEGEALFIIEWTWWCQWCRYVSFFDDHDKAKVKRILGFMVAGAMAPPPAKHEKEDKDDSSTDSEDADDPGPIDNSTLMMPAFSKGGTQAIFYQQWYKHLQDGDPALRPNLVRGFHYEIVPREVYNALNLWYGEITPRICRRIIQGKGAMMIDLYQKSETTPPAKAKQQQRCSACRARAATKRCTRCLSVWYCDRTCQEAHWTFHKQACSKIAAQRKNNDGGNPPANLPLTDGRVGLNNMGNTCFMNSALQCLSHATPLTRLFLSNQFLQDLNPNNPLGTGGKLANAFELCLKELWWKPQTSTSPTALKRAIALFAPRFAGCLQHDATEFLAYLLDGLHEDLNRIKKAPYVEMPDFDDNGSDTKANASLAWDCHHQRNDSLILDTFYGQFKSTCVCPNAQCGRVSVSFDAFNHVSLEIPQLQQSTCWLTFHVVGRAGSAAIVRYGMGLRRGSLMTDARLELSKYLGVPSTHLVICEVNDNVIVEIMHDDKPVNTISPNAMMTVYQVEPYTTSSLHIINTHTLVDYDASGELIRDVFGIPLLTSCDANLTCKQLWDHIWGSVRHMVVPLTEDGLPDDDVDPDLEDVYRQLLRLRVTDGEGNSMLVFPSDGEEAETDNLGEEKEEGGEEAPTVPRSPYVPPSVDEQISTFLGEDCTTRFLFLALEWTEKMEVPKELVAKNSTPSNGGGGGSTNNKKKKKMKKSSANNKAKLIPKSVQLEESRFLARVDHPTFIECMKKRREMEAARGVSLDQCFETFTKPERLDEHNMWYCANCKEHVRALKTMELWRLPNILMVHLKRFEFRHGYRREKLTTFVDFPMEGLDMSKHCAQWKDDGNDPPDELHVNDGVPAVYDLFAVVNHYGRMGFGHYTAFARKWDEEELSNDWALFDDSSVRSIGDGRIGHDGVVSPAAYVLFYRRRTFN